MEAGSPLFTPSHSAALACCFTSVICSIVFMFLSFHKKTCRNVFRQGTLINRLQIYLSIGDLLFGLWHGIDHSYVLATQKALDNTICQFMGFMMLWAINIKGFISCLVTFSAFIVVILERKLRFPKFDVFLLLVGMVLPFVLVVIAICFNWIGFTGVWCGVNAKTPAFSSLNIIYTGSINWLNIVISVFTYTCIFVKIIRSSLRVQGMKGDDGAKIMTPESIKMTKKFVIFVMVLLIQWMPLSVFLILAAAGQDVPYVIILGAVTFTNLGGLFNLLIHIGFRQAKVEQSGGSEPTKVTKA